MHDTTRTHRIRLFSLCRTCGAAALVAVLAHGGAQTAFAAKCLDQANGGAPNCTAEDIKVASIEVLEPVIEPCTGAGDTFTFDGILHVVSTASQRYDVGFYVGPNARSSNNDNCTVTILPAGGATNDGDVCGDVNSAGNFDVPVFNVTASCQDLDDNGFFDVSACSTWRQNASSTDCPDEAHALPGTSAKCKCGPVNTTLEIPQCTSNAECSDSLVCTNAVCDPASQNADGFGCTFPNLPSTTVCRPSTGVCDPAERCTGSTGLCPADSLRPSTTPCRGSTGICDPAENCDGSTAACPADAVSPSTTVCREASGVCDTAENCDGETGTCPIDTSGSGAVCRASTGVCDPEETCAGTSGTCPEDTLTPSSTECRGSSGVCDPPENCTGSTGSCPADTFTASSTECRASSGVCDPPENCDGETGACPTDALTSSTTICRASTGVCDPAERCTGASGACPADDPTAGDGTPCDDGLFCTTNDDCTSGTCSGEPLVCDDGKECSEDQCNEEEGKCDFTECEPEVDGVICRTAGYWGTHGGFEARRNATAVNVTQALLDAVGPLEVCGESISATSNLTKPYLAGLGLTSALEGLCVRVQTVQQRSLYRALVAAALNCAASGAANFCELIVPEFTDCDLLCQGTPPQDPPTVGECVELLDCFNNGGEMVTGGCAFGTCESQPLIDCGGDLGTCPDFNGLPQPCVPLEDSCHDAELCNEDIGFCPGDVPASSDGACREATSNNCTIDSCP